MRTVFKSAALLLIVWLFYLPSLRGTYQFDDYHHIVNNRELSSLRNIPSFFTDPRAFSSMRRQGMYRPVLLTSYALDYRLFGPDNAPARHAVNLIIHSINCLLFFLLARRFLSSPFAALIAALAFGLAAVGSQAVNYLSCRSSLLACFFMLCAIIVDRPGAGKKASVRAAGSVAAGLLFALGLGSKELAFALPLIVLARDLMVEEKPPGFFRTRLLPYASYLVLSASYIWLRIYFFGTPTSPHPARDIIPNLQAQAVSIPGYFIKALYPTGLSVFPYQPQPESFFDAGVMLGLSGILAALVVMAVSVRRIPLLSFGIAWFFVALLPSSSLAPLNMVVNESRAYFSTTGVVLGLAGLFTFMLRDAGRAKIKAAAAAALVAIIIQGFLTYERSSLWGDHEGLWRDAIKKWPESAEPYAYLGMHALVEGREASALRALSAALARDPGNALALFYTGLYFQSRGRENEAESVYTDMLRLDLIPEQRAGVLARLSLIETGRGNLAKARSYVEDALSIADEDQEILYALGFISEQGGDVEAALDYYMRALDMGESSPEIQTRIGIILLGRELYDQAIEYLSQAESQGAAWPELYLSLGVGYLKNGRLDIAREKLLKSLALDPDYAEAFLNLGVVEARAGNYLSAVGYFERALALDPENPLLYRNLAVMHLRRAEMETWGSEKRAEYLELAKPYLEWLGERHSAPDLEELYRELSGSEKSD